MKIPVEVSARHIHLSSKDLAKLFGKNFKLQKLRDLSQVGEFAARQVLVAFLSNRPKGRLSLRVVGPTRKESQIEISRTEAIKLGIAAPLRLSGDLKGVKSYLIVRGPKGSAKIKTIVAQRHLHCPSEFAKQHKLKNNKKVSIQVLGPRGLIFDNVLVRIGENYTLSCHIDTDEANACGLDKVCGIGELII